LEKCSVCGQQYGVTHSCSGPPTAQPVATWTTPIGFAPIKYLSQALAISRFDDRAIVAASLDSKSLPYGIAIWLVGQLLVYGRAIWIVANSRRAIFWPRAVSGCCTLLLVDAVWLLAQYGICHILACWLFRAHGRYVALLRPLLLGSVVSWVLIVPYVGMILSGFWSIAVMMLVFENVDGIDRLKAFGLSFVVGLVFLGVGHSLLNLP
jgi:hypothetical protein